MAAESATKASEETVVVSVAAPTKQRKKRKWDQPAESLVSAGLVPGSLPLGISSLAGAPVAGLNSLTSCILPNPGLVASTTLPQLFQPPVVPQNTATLSQKFNLPKIQDEVIAREIVINDADSTTRYKLTKRQTQEEIQKCTGAIVITRGKYRPPNSLPDGEKPLYLHISAGALLKDTAERIKAVDLAASMVEEILKHGHTFHPGHNINPDLSSGTLVSQPPSVCVYLGFDPDPSLNIAARIRGPNDQYISHIMNVTGATVLLRGRGLEHPENSSADAFAEMHQPPHLFLSSTNSRSLEEARILAENLLDTISVECGTSRMTSSKVYSAVPPPQQLLVDSTAGSITNSSPAISSVMQPAMPITPIYANTSMPTTSTLASAQIHTQSQLNSVSYPIPSISKGTNYDGYGDIYPQATPLQQVAQALRKAPVSASSAATVMTSAVSMTTGANLSTHRSSGVAVEAERRPQRRKFQESPATMCGSSEALQNQQPESRSLNNGKRNLSLMPPPMMLVQPAANGMPPPPPTGMPPPPPRRMSPPAPRTMAPSPTPPPKLQSQLAPRKAEKAEHVPDTLLKLMEYGDEDDDASDGRSDHSLSSGIPAAMTGKPFWAV